MPAPGEVRGLVLLCDLACTVQQVVTDSLGLGEELRVGRPFHELVEAGSTGKAFRFLSAVRTDGSAFDWELLLRIDDEITTLHFAGSVVNEQILIIGALSRNGMTRLFEEMVKINNEQANALRLALKDRECATRNGEMQTGTVYDEISRLNNELVAVQRELVKKNAQLEQLNQQKNQFLGMAAHDLRNPLGVIQTYSQFIMDEAENALSAEHREFIEVIHRSSEFMLRLIDDLLDISRIEAGKLDLDIQPVDLPALLRRNVALNQLLAARKAISLTCAVDDSAPLLELDVVKIEQVLNNLLGNAVKFSPAGSQVQVRLELLDGHVILSIADQGPGMGQEDLEKLFRPFQRGSVRSTAGEKSTGLGLAIARRVVEGHGGRIWVESQPGAGSTFFVLLPMPAGATAPAESPSEPAGAPEPVADAPAQSDPLRILLVEDNRINIVVATRVLERMGHLVSGAANGRQALEALERDVFDLVLMDMHMPELDGLETTALQRAREREKGTYTPIVALTGSASAADRQRCLEAGMDGFVSKPLRVEEIERVIAEVRAGRRE
jgi:two-component system, OmpR family, sensor kinase